MTFLGEHDTAYGIGPGLAALTLPGHVAAMAPAMGCGALGVAPPEPFRPR
ncbi:hypothetical protein [Streptomyces sp. PT12]|nr:hypothetical protein [Streptomyces sp. PT12]